MRILNEYGIDIPFKSALNTLLNIKTSDDIDVKNDYLNSVRQSIDKV